MSDMFRLGTKAFCVREMIRDKKALSLLREIIRDKNALSLLASDLEAILKI